MRRFLRNRLQAFRYLSEFRYIAEITWHSSKYAKLPDEEKEARKKEHIDDEAQQEEKEGAALSDVSLSGETVDALEEIKRMAEGLRTGIPENVSNRNMDTTAGSIDLKI